MARHTLNRKEKMSKHEDMTPVTEDKAKEWFDEWLDDVHSPIIIAGLTLSPSTVLRETDPIAYRTTFHDYIDRCQRDGWFLVEGY